MLHERGDTKRVTLSKTETGSRRGKVPDAARNRHANDFGCEAAVQRAEAFLTVDDGDRTKGRSIAIARRCWAVFVRVRWAVVAVTVGFVSVRVCREFVMSSQVMREFGLDARFGDVKGSVHSRGDGPR